MLRVLRDRLQRGRNGQRVNITRGQVNPKGMLTSPDGRWHYYKGMWMPAVAGGALDVGEGMDEVHFGFYGDLIPDELATSSDSGTITAMSASLAAVRAVPLSCELITQTMATMSSQRWTSAHLTTRCRTARCI